MNCQEALSLLYDVIDKEAGEIDAQQVKEHLARCSDCAGTFRLEQSVNELLQERLASQQTTPRLDSLQSRVLSQLDEVDLENRNDSVASDQSSPNSTPSVFRTGRYLAAAALVVVVAGAAYLANAIFDDHAVYLPLEEAHWLVMDNYDAIGSVATTQARAEIQQNLAYDVIDQIGTFVLAGAQLEIVDNMPVAHFVYHNDDHVVSVFVINSERLQIPDDLAATMISHNGFQFFDHNCRGCRLVYRKVGKALIVTATTVRNVELLDFIPDRSPV